jgi:hypothetical protein
MNLLQMLTDNGQTSVDLAVHSKEKKKTVKTKMNQGLFLPMSNFIGASKAIAA